MTRRALVAVDPQTDFMPGGALAVPFGDQIVQEINRMIVRSRGPKQWEMVVVTQDWHPKGHCSFKEQGGPWPEHGVVDSPGAALHKGLVFADPTFDMDGLVRVRKGVHLDVDSYSALIENDHWTETGLRGYLEGLGVKRVFVKEECECRQDNIATLTSDCVFSGIELYTNHVTVG